MTLILFITSTKISIVDAAQSSTFGRVFIFGFISNFRGDGPLLAIVSNTNDYETNVTVTSIYDTFETINIIVQPNSIEKVNVVVVKTKRRNKFVAIFRY